MPAAESPAAAARYLDVADLRSRWPLSRTAIYDLVATPDWCAQVRTLRIGDRIMFLEEDVLAVEASWVVTPEMARATATRRRMAKQAARACSAPDGTRNLAGEPATTGGSPATVQRPAMPPRKRAAYNRRKTAA